MKRLPREYLYDYTAAHTDIELAQVAIDSVERMTGGPRTSRIVALLQAEQQVALKKMDASAAKLGAPYPKANS